MNSLQFGGCGFLVESESVDMVNALGNKASDNKFMSNNCEWQYMKNETNNQ